MALPERAPQPPISRGPWRRLLTRRVGGPGALRWVTALVLVLSFLAGVLASHLLLKAGLSHPAARFPLVVGVAYGVFLLLIRVWLAWSRVTEQVGKPDAAHQEEESPAPSAAGSFVDKASNVADGLTTVADVGSLADAEGCLPVLGFLLLLAVLGFVATALWWLFGSLFGAAMAALVEAGAEAMLAVALARVAGGHAGSWLDGAVRATWRHWLALVAIAGGAGYLVRLADPTANTLLQLLRP